MPKKVSIRKYFVRAVLEVESVWSKIEGQQLMCFGHLMRIDNKKPMKVWQIRTTNSKAWKKKTKKSWKPPETKHHLFVRSNIFSKELEAMVQFEYELSYTFWNRQALGILAHFGNTAFCNPICAWRMEIWLRNYWSTPAAFVCTHPLNKSGVWIWMGDLTNYNGG